MLSGRALSATRFCRTIVALRTRTFASLTIMDESSVDVKLGEENIASASCEPLEDAALAVVASARKIESVEESAKRRLFMRNVKFRTQKEIAKLLTSNGVSKYQRIDKQTHQPFAFVVFETPEEANKAVDALCAVEVKGRPIQAKISNPKTIKGGKKRSRDGVSKDSKDEAPKTVEDAVTPWHAVPYDEQLKRKQDDMIRVLKRVTRQCRKRELNLNNRGKPKKGTKSTKTFSDLPPWMVPHHKNGSEERDTAKVGAISGCMCPLEALKPCPVTEGYRNKNEFTIGKNKEGDALVGFREGSFRDGNVTVARPTNCVNIPESCKALALAVEAFVNSSPLGVYVRHTHSGTWNTLLVKWSHQGEGMMCAIRYDPVGTDAEIMRNELERLQMELTGTSPSNPGPVASAPLFAGRKLTSLYLHPFSGMSAPRPEDYKLAWGSPVITERLDDQTFEISPAAFFQINTPAAEVLYATVRDFAKSGSAASDEKLPVILDVCCGTGTIGISMAKAAHAVIGVDLCASGIEDARRNAELNGLEEKTCFVASAAEHVLGKLLGVTESVNPKAKLSEAGPKNVEESLRAQNILAEAVAQNREIIAIVDPPRPGLHRSVVDTLRQCKPIKKLVYVSCNPSGSFVENAVDLCLSKNKKKRKGNPYTPKTAIGLDLFPHTPHTELVVLFERE